MIRLVAGSYREVSRFSWGRGSEPGNGLVHDGRVVAVAGEISNNFEDVSEQEAILFTPLTKGGGATAGAENDGSVVGNKRTV